MVVIGFFGDLLKNVGALVSFVSTDINTLYGGQVAVIGNWTILQMFSVGIASTLVFFFAIHFLRLVVGG